MHMRRALYGTCSEEGQKPGIASKGPSGKGLRGEENEDGRHHQLVRNRV